MFNFPNWAFVFLRSKQRDVKASISALIHSSSPVTSHEGALTYPMEADLTVPQPTTGPVSVINYFPEALNFNVRSQCYSLTIIIYLLVCLPVRSSLSEHGNALHGHPTVWTTCPLIRLAWSEIVRCANKPTSLECHRSLMCGWHPSLLNLSQSLSRGIYVALENRLSLQMSVRQFPSVCTSSSVE